jgi:hypothetical protein
LSQVESLLRFPQNTTTSIASTRNCGKAAGGSRIWDCIHLSTRAFGYQTRLPAFRYAGPLPCDLQSASVAGERPRLCASSSGESNPFLILLPCSPNCALFNVNRPAHLLLSRSSTGWRLF